MKIQYAEVMAGYTDIECPNCRAAIKSPCKGIGKSGVHSERWNLANLLVHNNPELSGVVLYFVNNEIENAPTKSRAKAVPSRNQDLATRALAAMVEKQQREIERLTASATDQTPHLRAV